MYAKGNRLHQPTSIGQWRMNIQFKTTEEVNCEIELWTVENKARGGSAQVTDAAV